MKKSSAYRKPYSINCPMSIYTTVEMFSKYSMLPIIRIIILAVEHKLNQIKRGKERKKVQLEHDKKNAKKVTFIISDERISNEMEAYITETGLTKTAFVLEAIVEFLEEYNLHFIYFEKIVLTSNDGFQNVCLVNSKLFVQFFSQEILDEISNFYYKPHVKESGISRVKRKDLINLFEKKLMI